MLIAAMAYRRNARIAADEYCSAIQLNRLFGMEGSTLISECLGLFETELNWIAPDGRYCTVLCNRSDLGGFDSLEWTLDGWILSDHSMAQLRAEFPNEFANPDEVAKPDEAANPDEVANR